MASSTLCNSTPAQLPLPGASREKPCLGAPDRRFNLKVVVARCMINAAPNHWLAALILHVRFASH